jgi:hypothetical protein
MSAGTKVILIDVHRGFPQSVHKNARYCLKLGQGRFFNKKVKISLFQAMEAHRVARG